MMNFWFALLFSLLGPSNAADATTTSLCVRENAHRCGLLMFSLSSSMTIPPDSECDCYDFCNGEFVGCGGSDDSSTTTTAVCAEGSDGRERVRGCTIDDAMISTNEHQEEDQEMTTTAATTFTEEQRSLQNVIYLGNPLPSCPAGTFRQGVGAPCVACLRCAYNARALVTCVTRGNDPSQCQCNAGLVPNGRGGCLPQRTGSTVIAPAAPRPCIGCGWNSYPLVSCVTNAADVRQCACNTGYVSNGRGGCDRAYPAIQPQAQPIGPRQPAPAPVRVPQPVTAPTAPVRPTASGQLDLCPQNYCRAAPGAPCRWRESCGPHGVPFVMCVLDNADPNQCGCTTGYRLVTQVDGNGACIAIGGGQIDNGGGGGGPAPPSCPFGSYYRNGSCVPCQSCPWNASPLVQCVQLVGDPAQCQCNSGYTTNYRGGCLPIGTTSTTLDAIESGGATANHFAPGAMPAFFLASMMMILAMNHVW